MSPDASPISRGASWFVSVMLSWQVRCWYAQSSENTATVGAGVGATVSHGHGAHVMLGHVVFIVMFAHGAVAFGHGAVMFGSWPVQRTVTSKVPVSFRSAPSTTSQ